jgi:hypothetical protein
LHCGWRREELEENGAGRKRRNYWGEKIIGVKWIVKLSGKEGN